MYSKVLCILLITTAVVQAIPLNPVVEKESSQKPEFRSSEESSAYSPEETFEDVLGGANSGNSAGHYGTRTITKSSHHVSTFHSSNDKIIPMSQNQYHIGGGSFAHNLETFLPKHPNDAFDSYGDGKSGQISSKVRRQAVASNNHGHDEKQRYSGGSNSNGVHQKTSEYEISGHSAYDKSHNGNNGQMMNKITVEGNVPHEEASPQTPRVKSASSVVLQTGTGEGSHGDLDDLATSSFGGNSGTRTITKSSHHVSTFHSSNDKIIPMSQNQQHIGGGSSAYDLETFLHKHPNDAFDSYGDEKSGQISSKVRRHTVESNNHGHDEKQRYSGGSYSNGVNQKTSKYHISGHSAYDKSHNGNNGQGMTKITVEDNVPHKEADTSEGSLGDLDDLATNNFGGNSGTRTITKSFHQVTVHTSNNKIIPMSQNQLHIGEGSSAHDLENLLSKHVHDAYGSYGDGKSGQISKKFRRHTVENNNHGHDEKKRNSGGSYSSGVYQKTPEYQISGDNAYVKRHHGNNGQIITKTYQMKVNGKDVPPETIRHLLEKSQGNSLLHHLTSGHGLNSDYNYGSHDSRINGNSEIPYLQKPVDDRESGPGKLAVDGTSRINTRVAENPDPKDNWEHVHL